MLPLYHFLPAAIEIAASEMVKCLSHLILLSPFFTYGKLTDACWKCWDENAAACPTVCAGPGAHTATQTSAFEVAEAGAFWPTGDRSSKQEVRLGSLETGPRGAVSPVLHSREPDLPHPPRCHIYLALKTCCPSLFSRCRHPSPELFQPLPPGQTCGSSWALGHAFP